MDFEKGELLLGSISIAISTSALITLPMKLVGMDKLLATGACIVVVTPISYTIGKLIRQRFEEKMEKEMDQARHMGLMLKEANNPDRMIESSTSLFSREISLAIKKGEIELSDDNSFLVLNQFLYLLNSNYYDRLQKKFPSFTRKINRSRFI